MVGFRIAYSSGLLDKYYDFYVIKNSYWIKKLNKILSVDGIVPFSKSLFASTVDLSGNPIECKVITSAHRKFYFLLYKVDVEEYEDGTFFHIFLRSM